MTLKHEKRNMMLAGLVIGVIASLLVPASCETPPVRSGFTRQRRCSTSALKSSVWCSEAS